MARIVHGAWSMGLNMVLGAWVLTWCLRHGGYGSLKGSGMGFGAWGSWGIWGMAVWGMGHGAWGAWGMGHGAWGVWGMEGI